MSEIYAVLLGSVLGFIGALGATMVQSRTEEKRALRAELAHRAAKFMVLGEELAWMNLEIYDHRLGGNRKPIAESLDESLRISSLINDRNAKRDEMLLNIAAFRIGYPHLAPIAQEYFDETDNKDRENVAVVAVEVLPEAKEKFEMCVRSLIKIKPPKVNLSNHREIRNSTSA